MWYLEIHRGMGVFLSTKEDSDSIRFLTEHRKQLVDSVIKDICAINKDRFDARIKLKFIHKFNKAERFENITDDDFRRLDNNIAPLIPTSNDDKLAKRFDYLIYTI